MFKLRSATREREPDTYVPYLGHAAPGVMLLDNGDKLAMLHLRGVAWETADDDQINAQHSNLNVLLRNIASDRLVLCSHVVRTLADPREYPAGSCRSSFASALNAAYQARLSHNRLYRNDLYLSVLLRPSQATGKRVSGLLNRRRRGDTGRAVSTPDMDRLETVPSRRSLRICRPTSLTA